MLFNSYEFLFAFLPLTLSIYFLLNRYEWISTAKLYLLGASLFFYGWWNVNYLLLILSSIAINFIMSSAILNCEALGQKSRKKHLFISALVFNLGLLIYFKYTDFFITTGNTLFNNNWPLVHLALPLAISFFTLQQIAFLVDAYEGVVTKPSPLDYGLFVAFFPQLIAGPIVHHREMLPQFYNLKNRFIDYENFTKGVCLFILGLFKKIVIADTFANWVNSGFSNTEQLTFFDAWIASFSYTFQLYFDFSGYTDMALGIALMFNIVLPTNFNSPYQACNIIDFWRRWHMTLSRFLKNYLYIPLGGNRKGSLRRYNNLMITMLIGGLWHGAAWIFVIWGGIHGIGLVNNHYWRKCEIYIPRWLSWGMTFGLVTIAFVPFRAENLQIAIDIWYGMLGFKGAVLPVPVSFRPMLAFLNEVGINFAVGGAMDFFTKTFGILISFFLIWRPNAYQIASSFKGSNSWHIMGLAFLLVVSIIFLKHRSPFIYFIF